MSSKELDVDFLSELLDGDREFAQELFAIFAETSLQCLRSAEVACQGRDRDGARRAFHTLKGAAASVGLAEVRGKSRTLELMAEQSNFSGCDRGLADLGETVEKGHALLGSFLEGYGL